MLPRIKGLITRHRTTAALFASLTLHLVAILTFFMPSSTSVSPKFTTGLLVNNDKEGVDVVLVSIGGTKGVTEQSPVNTFTPMVETLPTDNWTSLSVPKSTNTIREVFGEDVFADTPQATPATSRPNQAERLKIRDNTNKSLNDLWAAIEPCWRKMADERAESVVLNVSFSPTGNLAKPPVIVREPGTQSTEQRLRSEAQAINALAQCGPYPMAFGQTGVRVKFPKGVG